MYKPWWLFKCANSIYKLYNFTSDQWEPACKHRKDPTVLGKMEAPPCKSPEGQGYNKKTPMISFERPRPIPPEQLESSQKSIAIVQVPMNCLPHPKRIFSVIEMGPGDRSSGEEADRLEKVVTATKRRTKPMKLGRREAVRTGISKKSRF